LCENRLGEALRWCTGEGELLKTRVRFLLLDGKIELKMVEESHKSERAGCVKSSHSFG